MLLEALEQHGYLLGRETNPGICHRAVDQDTGVRLLSDPDRYDDFAFFSELDRIAKQVAEHLPEVVHVALDLHLYAALLGLEVLHHGIKIVFGVGEDKQWSSSWFLEDWQKARLRNNT